MTNSEFAVAPTAPEIPAGPGVRPPFAVPPREGNRRRMWIGIAIGVAVLLVCGGGGVFGLGALVVTTTNQRLDDARTVVTRFMTDWQKQDFSAAYQLLCDDQRQRTSTIGLASDLGTRPVDSFAVQDPALASNAVEVPVRITYVVGNTEIERFTVTVDSDGQSRICGTV